MQKRIEVKVTGRVQMVMFRDFTTRKARSLGIFGEVENVSDGSVSIRAEGEEENLKSFLEKIHKGSLLSKVEKVEVVWKEPVGHFLNFKIRFSK